MNKIFLVILIAVCIILIIPLYFLFDIILSNLSSKGEIDKLNYIKGVETCESISPRSYSTALIFNPEDYGIFYLRSECFKRLAVRNRDEKLCEKVRERKSLFYDGSAVSKEACLREVKKQKESNFAERVQVETIHKIQALNITQPRPGDFDVRVTTIGSLWATYKFSLKLYDLDKNFIGTLYDIETHMGSSGGTLFYTVYQKDIKRLVGNDYSEGQKYLLQVSLKLIRDDAGQLERSNLPPSVLESSLEQFIVT